MKDVKQVRTRIAPSPTGKMHLGTARTALFNLLFARRLGGEYCVRIENTDAMRSTEENINFIKGAFEWLGLEPDDAYVLQSENINSHREAVDSLLEAKKAYEDDGAIRFKVETGTTAWDDLVQGHIAYNHKEIEDFVIQRSDGTPTYHLAVVVDDINMEISHVIRGDDHINNTPKQILLHKALGHAVPAFAHVPLIHGSDGKKLSKRHGAASVQEYHEQGFLPEALCHYLMQLSWLPGDIMEPISIENAAKKFDIKAIKKGAATFDSKKLEALNSVYLKASTNENLLDLITDQMGRHGVTISDEASARMLRGMGSLKSRAKTLVELAEAAAVYVEEAPFSFSTEAGKALLEGQEHITYLMPEFAEAEWDGALIHAIIKDYVSEQELKFPAVGKPLRVALTGRIQGAGVGDIMLALGKAESLRRLKLALSI